MKPKRSFSHRSFITDEAIVIDVRPASRSDQKVWFLCRQHGLILCIAPGGRRPKKPWGGLLSLLARGSLTYKVSTSHPDWHYLIQFENAWSPAMNQPMTPEYLVFASFVCEVARSFLSMHEPETEIFDILSAFIDRSTHQVPLRGLATGWCWILLWKLGYLSLSGDCPACGRPVLPEKGTILWDTEGHPWHPACREPIRERDFMLPDKYVQALAYLARSPLAVPDKVFRFLARKPELFQYFIYRSQEVLGHPLQSLDSARLLRT